MSTDKICYVSCVVGNDARYYEQQDRMVQSIHEVESDSDLLIWRNCLPEGARHHHISPYGFKPYAVLQAWHKGYTKVVWLDAACILVRPSDEWWHYYMPSVSAAKDDNKLHGFCSSEAYEHFEVIPDTKHHLVGGSVYVFNFNRNNSWNILKSWMSAEENNLFKGPPHHRHDEACMALALYSNLIEPQSCELMYYNCAENPIIVKQHFK